MQRDVTAQGAAILKGDRRRRAEPGERDLPTTLENFMTGSELDEILAESNQEAVDATEEVVQQEEGQHRDEQGRFAGKADEPEVVAEAVEEAAQEEPEAGPGKVPQQALHAAREKEREARQEAEQLRREMAELRGHVQALSQRPAKQEEQKPEEKAHFWDDPDRFVESRLNPVQQQLQQQREQFSKMLAVQAHGTETVDAAYSAIVEAAKANPASVAGDYQAIMRSEHPYDALVAWHKRQETLRTVGTDPNAWLEQEMEKRLADPAYQAKVLEKIKGAAAANANRSNPVTNLPPSLSRLPAGGNTAQDNDVSDAALFSHATR